MLTGVLSQQDILYRDADLLAVNKPAAVPMHGSRILADQPETLISMVRSHTGLLVHAAHRLDRPVSGVVVMAQSRQILVLLGQQFERRKARKCYLAVCRGWTDAEGIIAHPLLPPRDERKAHSRKRDATTRYERIARAELPFPVRPYDSSRYSLLGLFPETGRRHQLRRHMKHISHHLIGDSTYGRGEHNRMFREKFACRRLLLHAWSLELEHPVSGAEMRFTAPLDPPFTKIVRDMGWSEALTEWSDRRQESARV